MKRNLRLTGLMLFGLVLGGLQAHANALPFSHVVVFGTSLSDPGNYYRLSGGSPASPYFEGRFCNGPLWVEYLALGLGMPLEPGWNFAVGGATTGNANVNDGYAGKEYPGLSEEIAGFLAGRAPTEPARALYIVEAGANDFFMGLQAGVPPATIIANGVNNTATAIQALWASGARIILVMNLPDVGVSPAAKAIGMGPALTQLSAAYNQVLNMALDRLNAAGISTIRLDAFAMLDDMAYNPEKYGFSNVETPFLMAPTGNDAETFLFWDAKHPTTGAHAVLAEEALAQLLNEFSPAEGQGTPDARANSLHGLVNARLRRP